VLLVPLVSLPVIVVTLLLTKLLIASAMLLWCRGRFTSRPRCAVRSRPTSVAVYVKLASKLRGRPLVLRAAKVPLIPPSARSMT
jgi:hypothetical protein